MITPAFEFYKGSIRVEADQAALLAALADLFADALQSALVLALSDCHAESLLFLPVRRDISANMEAGLVVYFVAQVGL